MLTKILQGQVWRLDDLDRFCRQVQRQRVFWFVIAVLFLYYPIGTSLEHTWGSLRYTIYIASGMVFTIIGAFALYLIAVYGLGYDGVSDGVWNYFTTYYISVSVFLAYGVYFPKYAGNAVFYYSDQDELDVHFLRSDDHIRDDQLYPYGCLVYGCIDRCIPSEFCYLFSGNAGSSTL